MPHIFVDMDGVIANFDEGFPRLFNVNHGQIGDASMWGLAEAHPNFFGSLAPMPGAMGLLKALAPQKPTVLTAVPKMFPERAAEQKRAWLDAMVPFEIAMIAARGGKDKHEHMIAKGDILIDDWGPNIEAWEAAGGVGIKHRDPLETYERLLTLGVQMDCGHTEEFVVPSWQRRKEKAEFWMTDNRADGLISRLTPGIAGVRRALIRRLDLIGDTIADEDLLLDRACTLYVLALRKGMEHDAARDAAMKVLDMHHEFQGVVISEGLMIEDIDQYRSACLKVLSRETDWARHDGRGGDAAWINGTYSKVLVLDRPQDAAEGANDLQAYRDSVLKILDDEIRWCQNVSMSSADRRWIQSVRDRIAMVPLPPLPLQLTHEPAMSM